MSKDSVDDWSETASDNTDVGGINIDENCDAANMNNMGRTMMAQLATRFKRAEPGYLYGLTISNGSDAVNDITVAAGRAASSGDPSYMMVLASAITKQLDNAWSVGNNAGGLDTGSIADTTYHMYLIMRSDTGVVDACFSVSASGPTIGSNIPVAYDRYRRIASVIRSNPGSGSTILAFDQNDDHFQTAAFTARSSTSVASNALVTVRTPNGIKTQPILSNTVVQNTADRITVSVGNGSGTTTPRVIASTAGDGGNVQTGTVDGGIFTDTSSRIRYSTSLSSGTMAANELYNHGWIDTRGRLG